MQFSLGELGFTLHDDSSALFQSSLSRRKFTLLMLSQAVFEVHSPGKNTFFKFS